MSPIVAAPDPWACPHCGSRLQWRRTEVACPRPRCYRVRNPSPTQLEDSAGCRCGLDLHIWQNSWNHRAGCDMRPAKAARSLTE